VRASVWTNKAPNRARKANKTGQARAGPANAITIQCQQESSNFFGAHLLELCEDVFRWCVVGHDPEGEQEREEPEDVQEQNDTLGKRQVLSEKDVESDCQCDKQEHCQRRLPCEFVLSLWVREFDHFLDNPGELQPASRHSSDPTEATKPANDVRQWFLHGLGSEFADEVVLASCGRRHRCQLTHRSDREHHEQPDCDHGVDDARGAAIGKSEVAGEQGVLPCSLQDRNEADNTDKLEVSLRLISMQFAPIGVLGICAEHTRSSWVLPILDISRSSSEVPPFIWAAVLFSCISSSDGWCSTVLVSGSDIAAVQWLRKAMLGVMVGGEVLNVIGECCGEKQSTDRLI